MRMRFATKGRQIRAYLGTVAEDGWFLVVLLNGLGVEVQGSRPVVGHNSLVALQLERVGSLFVGSHCGGKEGHETTDRGRFAKRKGGSKREKNRWRNGFSVE